MTVPVDVYWLLPENKNLQFYHQHSLGIVAHFVIFMDNIEVFVDRKPDVCV